MRISKGLTQAYVLRDLSFNLAQKLYDSTATEREREDAPSINGAIRSWEAADERVRIHRGKPLPGTLRPTAVRQQRSRGGAGEHVPAPVEPRLVVSAPAPAPVVPQAAPGIATPIVVSGMPGEAQEDVSTA